MRVSAKEENPGVSLNLPSLAFGLATPKDLANTTDDYRVNDLAKLTPDEVRERVNQALSELEGEDYNLNFTVRRCFDCGQVGRDCSLVCAIENQY